jgi:hypothetical protein
LKKKMKKKNISFPIKVFAISGNSEHTQKGGGGMQEISTLGQVVRRRRGERERERTNKKMNLVATMFACQPVCHRQRMHFARAKMNGSL